MACYNNENIFTLEHLPEKLLVVGGGPIGIELGQAFNFLGSKVVVVQNYQQILQKEHPEISDFLQKKLKNEGMKFYLNAEVERFTDKHHARIKSGDKIVEEDFDHVLVSIGRNLNHEHLNLSKAGIATQNGSIVLDSYLRTTNKDVVVSGDAAGRLKFSHAAEMHDRILINNFFSPIKKSVNTTNFSWVTFTEPEIATFGLREKELKEKNIHYTKLKSNFSVDDRAVIGNYQDSKIMLYISKGNIFGNKNKLLGGTIVAPNAGELVQELILAKQEGLSIQSLFNKIYPYPTASRINQKVIVDFNQKRITPFVKKGLKWLYKWMSEL